MGVPETSCKCLKTCKDKKGEMELEKGDYLRTKTGNNKMNNNNQKILNNFQQSKGVSINSVSGKTEIISISKENSFTNKNNYKNNIKETLQNANVEEIEENKNINTDNNILKTINSINDNKDKKDEKQEEKKEERNEEKKEELKEDENEFKEKNDNDINSNSENSNSENMCNNKDNEEQKKENSKSNPLKDENNIDKSIFFTETLKRAEKNFDSPLDYEKDWSQYFDEDEDNEEIPILLNTMNSNQGEKNTKEEGEIIELKGKKCLYKGQMDNNHNPCGFGELYTQNGEKYEGNFCLGKLIGLGRYINKEGICFEGIFKNNDLVSKATIIYLNEKNQKIYYFGEVSNFAKNGMGKEITDEYRYTGYFVDNLREGDGRIEFLENGELYEGEFTKGKINGKGLYIWSNKNVYKGDFVNGIKHGKGKYKWPDGCEYEGDYNNGEREGYGTYKWKDGRIFTGRFKSGVPDGKGKLTYKGKCVNIEYRNGKPIQDIKTLFRAG